MGIMNQPMNEEDKARLEAMEKNIETITAALQGIDGYKDQLSALNSRLDEIKTSTGASIDKLRNDTFDALKCISAADPPVNAPADTAPGIPTINEFITAE